MKGWQTVTYFFFILFIDINPHLNSLKMKEVGRKRYSSIIVVMSLKALSPSLHEISKLTWTSWRINKFNKEPSWLFLPNKLRKTREMEARQMKTFTFKFNNRGKREIYARANEKPQASYALLKILLFFLSRIGSEYFLFFCPK